MNGVSTTRRPRGNDHGLIQSRRGRERSSVRRFVDRQKESDGREKGTMQVHPASIDTEEALSECHPVVRQNEFDYLDS